MEKKMKKIGDNQNDTDVVLNSGQYMPRAVYINKYGKDKRREKKRGWLKIKYFVQNDFFLSLLWV